MKPSTTDYLSITAALVAILLCGYGIGFLVGERTTLNRVGNGTIVNQAPDDWSASTVERLRSELKLNETQAKLVEREVATTAKEIAAARGEAIRNYRLALLRLHERLIPQLDQNQREIIQKSAETLKKSLDIP